MRPGLIAGGGSLPPMLIEEWEEKGLDPAVIAIDGFADKSLIKNRTGRMIPLGGAGQMISFLKTNKVTDLVITGRVSRPDFFKIKPDPKGMMVIAKILLKKKIGDDGLLRLIRGEIEKEGFKIRAVQEFLPGLLTPSGLLGKIQIPDDARSSISLGFQAAIAHGLEDLGQSIVVQNETVIGLEGDKGTNSLIREAAKNKQETGLGPILVKACKPQQDKALDLPTIGLSTAKEAADAGFAGIVLQAHETLLLDRTEVINFCNARNMFLFGLTA